MLAHRTLSLLVAAAGLLLVPGCLERKETIAVDLDGSVQMEMAYEGDLADFKAGDALPDESTGWVVTDNDTAKDNGDVERERSATRHFAADEPLPDSYADPSSTDYAVALRFPTTVRITSTAEGTYYDFKRVYMPREEARYNLLRVKHEDVFQELETLTDKSPEELTDSDKARVIEILRVIETFKRAEYVDAGAAAMADAWPQHYGLLLRQALIDHFQQADVGPLLDLMAQSDSPERNADIDAFSKRMIADADAALAEQLNELGVSTEQAERFFAACDEEEARRGVTEDIADESWKVTVTLPGTIVAHNGDRAEGGEVAWEFSGKMLYDREQVLMATSFVPAAGSRDASAVSENAGE